MSATASAAARPAPDELFERVEALQEQLDGVEDGPARELADQLVAAVVQLYGAGLERLLERVSASEAHGARLAVELTEDPFLATLLLIHDLHPVSLEDRVQGALDSVRPYLNSHGGDVDLLGLEHGIARLHLRGSCSDCSASSVTLELAIKQALEQAAPDLEGLEVEGIGVGAPAPVGGDLPMATGTAPPSGLELPVVVSAPPAWIEVPDAGEVAEGTIVGVTVAGRALLIANVEGTLLAYGDRCAACDGELHDGRLNAGALTCPDCWRSFLLTRAGRSLDDSGLQLEPVPLLREAGTVRVALSS